MLAGKENRWEASYDPKNPKPTPLPRLPRPAKHTVVNIPNSSGLVIQSCGAALFDVATNRMCNTYRVSQRDMKDVIPATSSDGKFPTPDTEGRHMGSSTVTRIFIQFLLSRSLELNSIDPRRNRLSRN
jgi:hypothetical protein